MEAPALLQVLRRRSAAVAACFVAGVAGSLILTAATPEVYESTADVFVNVPAASNVQNGVQGVQLTADLLPSYAEIATSRLVTAKIKERLGLAESPEVLRRKLAATALPQKLILQISARDGDRVRSRALANAATAALAETVSELEADRAPGAAVELQIIDPALAGRQVEPRPSYNVAVGLLLGLGAGLLLALILDALDTSVKTPEQAQAAAGTNVLGALPRRKDSKRAAPVHQGDPAAEAYRTLRTGVRFAQPDHHIRSLLITSPSAAEGKTSTAVNLAIALAQSGERTLLVDADLRRPNVAEALGLEGAVGLSQVITGAAALSDVLQEWQHGLMVLPAGAIPPNPSELLGSRSLQRLLEDLEQLADIVLLDSPPVLPVADAAVLSTQVDGVLMVLYAGRTNKKLAATARGRLDAVGANVIGVVLNGARSAFTDYYAPYASPPVSEL